MVHIVPQPPLVPLSTVVKVVGQGWVHMAISVAHETVSQGPKDWHGVAGTVNVGMLTPMQLQGRVPTSLLVHVGAGQKVQGVAPVVTSEVPHLAARSRLLKEISVSLPFRN